MKRKDSHNNFLLLLVAAVVVGSIIIHHECDAISFDLGLREQKCFKEELPQNFDVYGEYEVLNSLKGVPIYLRVTDSNGIVLVDRANLKKGDFSFVTEEGGEYKFCFTSRISNRYKHAKGVSHIQFDVLTGTETFDYESLARKEHLKPVEVNLRMMEDIVKSIHSEYVYHRKREAAMKNTNDSTNSRVSYLSTLALIIMVVSSVWQIFYLKSYFIRKKLI